MKVRCSKCKGVYSIPDERLRGKTGRVKVRCPKCRAVLALPAGGPRPQVEAEKPEWYYAKDGAQQGPVALSQLQQFLTSGSLPVSALVWRPGLETWNPANTVEELRQAAGPQPEEHAAEGHEEVHPHKEREEPEEALPPEPGEQFPERTMDLDSAGLDRLSEPAGVTAGGDTPATVESGAETALSAVAEPGAAAVPAAEKEPLAAPVQRELPFAGHAEPATELASATTPESGAFPGPAAFPEPLATEEPGPVTAAPARADALFTAAEDEPAAAAEPEPVWPREAEPVVAQGPEPEAPAPEPEAPVPQAETEAAPAAEERFDDVGATEVSRPAADLFGFEGQGATAGQPSPVPEEEEEEEAAIPRRTARQEADEEDDMFAAFDKQAEKPKPAPKAGSGKGQEMLHSRHETSVLFSLDEVIQKRPEKEPGKGKAEDSGLIDIRQISLGKEEDDLFAGMSDKSPAAASAAARMPLAMPILKKRSRWPLAVGASAGGLVVLAGLVYAAFALFAMMTGGTEIIGQTLASASERAFKQKLTRVDELKEAHRTRLEGVRKTGEDAVKVAAAQAETELTGLQARTQAELAELRTTQEKQIMETEAAVAKARAEAERKKAMLAAATAPAGTVGLPAGSGGTPPPGAAAAGAKGTAPDKKKELTAKEKAKEKDKKKESEKAAAAGAIPVKDEKKETVEKKEEPAVADAGKKDEKDPAALLKMLDEKKGAGEESGGASGAAEKKTLTTTDIMKVVNGNKGAMRSCFQKYGAGLETATIRTKLTIAGSGAVTDVTISSMEFAGTALGNCVRGVQMKMKFPSFATPSLSKAISVRLP